MIKQIHCSETGVKVNACTMVNKPNQRVTLRDVARTVGVSINAVSAVLNNRNSNVRVSPETRNAILAVARKLDYQRNVAASTLAGGRTRTLGILMPNLYNIFCSAIVESFEREVSLRDYQCFVGCTQYDEAMKMHYIERMLGYEVQGLLLLTGWRDPEIKLGLQKVMDQNTPMIFVDYSWDEFKVPLICSNHHAGGRMIGQHLLEVGHRRFVFSVPPFEIQATSVRERYSGLQEILQEAGLPENALSLYVWPSDDKIQSGLHLDEYLRENRDITVIVSSTDVTALASSHGLLQRGWHVPDDIAITGYDDILGSIFNSPGFGSSPWMTSELVTNQLTTVRQPLSLIGQKAAEVMIRMVESQQPNEATDYLLDVELVIRGSSRMPHRKVKSKFASN